MRIKVAICIVSLAISAYALAVIVFIVNGCRDRSMSRDSSDSATTTKSSARQISDYLLVADDHNVKLLSLADRSVRSVFTTSRFIKLAASLRTPNKFALVVTDKAADTSSAGEELILVDRFVGETFKLGRHQQIGLPVSSQDASQMAVVVSDSISKSQLLIIRLSDSQEVWKLDGPFKVDSAGPQWAHDRPGEHSLVVALLDGTIAEVSIEARRFSTLCTGEMPSLLLPDRALVYQNQEAIWQYNIQDKSSSHLVNFESIAPLYRAVSVSPAGDRLAAQTFQLVGLKSTPSIVVVDLQTMKVTIVESFLQHRGPWAWIRE